MNVKTHLKKLLTDLGDAYRFHHQWNPALLEWIGAIGAFALSGFYLLRFAGPLPNRWDDLAFRCIAIALCIALALRRRWPRRFARLYLLYSYFTVFYCLAFFLPLTLLKNQAAPNTVANMMVGAVLVSLLTDWRNSLVLLFAGYVFSFAFYWAFASQPQFPLEFLVWCVPLCAVLAAGISIAKFLERRSYTFLAGSIAHETRTPLALAQHSLDEIAGLAASNGSISEAADRGRSAVRRGLQAITLTLRQLNETTLAQSRFQPLSAAQCVHKAVEEFAYEDPQHRQKISVSVDQDFAFDGDETAMVLILFNLLKNALYYLPVRPDVVVDIRLECLPVPRIVVRDTGPGIAPELMERLFEDFQTAGKVTGSGLGLAFCRRTMRALGGEITCRSVLGAFTEFTLAFPLAEMQTLRAAQPLANKPAGAGCDNPSLAGRMILVVDDSELNRTVARLTLAEMGAEVAEATHADDALRMLHQGCRPDAILMDMTMPGMSGPEATRRLRDQPGPCRDVPVVALTANPLGIGGNAAFAAGMDGYLVKPVQPELLRLELLRVLAQAGAQTSSHSLRM